MQPPPVASNPGFPSQILSRTFGENLPAVWNKIRDEKLGFEATPTAEDSSHHNARAQLGGVQFVQVYSLYFADNF